MKLKIRNNENIMPLSLNVILICIAFFILLFSNIYGAEIYSKNDKPFGIPFGDWIGRFWKWNINLTIDEHEHPKSGGCLINNSSSMVLLMETTVQNPPVQVCKISSAQGLVVPIWTAFQEDSPGYEKDYSKFSYEALSEEARRIGDMGLIKGNVVVDGIKIANLDVDSSPTGVKPRTPNGMDNITEVYSKGFNITIPKAGVTWMEGQHEGGPYRSGAHAFAVFLKPLPVANHTISYFSNRGGELATAPGNSTIKYNIQVEK